jgi:hypothetical protein
VNDLAIGEIASVIDTWGDDIKADKHLSAPSPGFLPIADALSGRPYLDVDVCKAWVYIQKLYAMGDLRTDSRFLRSNGLPNHPHGPFPNMNDANGDGKPDFVHSLSAQAYEVHLPLTPQVSSHVYSLTKASSGQGAIGFALNGVPFFHPFDAHGNNVVDISSDHFLMTDCCNGRPDANGRYYYATYQNAY